MRRALETLVALLLAVPAARAAVVAAPGYAVHTITTPDTVEGGVVRQGDAILVGQGPGCTAGAQSVVRLDAGGPATIATGFNSLGGFDLAPDGTLYVVDNCFTGDGCGTTTTGDTLYAIPDALTRTTAVTAAGHEVVPSGTIPFAGDVFVAPGGAALVSDAAGNGAGRVVKVVPGMATDLISGLDLVGGITLAADGTLRIVDAFLNPDFSTTGKVLEYKADGTPLGTLVSGLEGGFAAATDGAGNVLVSGIGSFGTSKVIAVAPDGSVSDRATGFAFSSDVFFDAARDEALVLDFGVADIAALCRHRDGLEGEEERRLHVPQRPGRHPRHSEGGAQALEQGAGAGAVRGRRQDRELRRRPRAPAAAGDTHPRRGRRPVRRRRLRRPRAGAGLRLQGEAREGAV